MLLAHLLEKGTQVSLVEGLRQAAQIDAALPAFLDGDLVEKLDRVFTA